ncbi:ATP-dependent Clp protease ATP-binding subunit [Patescibacteria group bacterium]|nr:ATP-dependent Clp protease ATP-binding subunit [Patescibacteria group bacterium]MBU1890530.1 ATP-dependent Clp protease ATP-binding subunit [Patescibacteria group bacterium]
MNIETLSKFTTHLKNALLKASDLASDWGHETISPEHLIVGLSIQKGSIGAEILNKLGIKKESVKEIVLKHCPIKKTEQSKSVVPSFSEEAKEVLVQSGLVASQYKHRYIGTEHLLSALVSLNHPIIKDVIDQNKVKTSYLRQQILMVMKSTSKFPDLTEIFENNSIELARPEEKASALSYFCTDLTSTKLQDKIDPVIGRADELDRLIHILSRRTKNNPVLIGDPGVGKTAIVEGLGKKILNQDVPDILLNKKILCLDLSAVLAGTIYRGEFEARFKQIIDEIKKDSNVILFIDELHTIIGTGGATGTLDAANILKPALAKGNIRCIGATTLEEYRKHIESDPALERRFQPIIVEEPTGAETIDVLKGIKRNYERYHGVNITDDAIIAAVELSQRYIQEKFLPDKAIDLVDEAASKFKVTRKQDGLMKKIILTEKEIETLELKKHDYVTKEDFSVALRIKTQQELLRQRLSNLKEKQNRTKKYLKGEIDKNSIAEIVSKITQVPLHDLLQQEKDKLLTLEKILARRVIGQNEAIATIAQYVRRSRAGLAAPERPIGSFLFLGPSGVGKTELAKVLAEEVYQDKNSLIRIDMSEFNESFQVSKLIGAPAGYVGYKDGGKLTDSVKRKPYSVVLFDEVEKAHPDVFNLLLQVLEDGHLTDAAGKKVNFKNTIIILTSNIGVAELNRIVSMGFNGSNSETETQERYEEIKEEILKNLKKEFRPEFINRLDKTIVFQALSRGDIHKIVELQLAELEQRLRSQSIVIQPTNKAVEYIAQHGFRPDEGARAIRKIIQDEVESPLAEALITNKYKPGSAMKLDVHKNSIVIK